MTDKEIFRRMDWPAAFASRVGRDDLATRISALVLAAEAAERESCAALLDAEHEKSKRIHNYAAYYARMIRERLNSVV